MSSAGVTAEGVTAERSEFSGKSRYQIVGVWVLLGAIAAVTMYLGVHRVPIGAVNARRIAQLESELKCPVCNDISVAQSEVKVASDMRSQIASFVNKGMSDVQVEQYYEARYGRQILLSPPRSGFAGLVWVLPAVVVVAAGALGGWVLFVRRSEIEMPVPAVGTSKETVTELPNQKVQLDPKRKHKNRWVLVTGIACLIAGLSFFVIRTLGGSSQSRLPSGSITGSTKLSKGQEVTQLLADAKILASDGRYPEATNAYSQVLAIEPRQAEALAYKGWLLQLAGKAGNDPKLVGQAASYERAALKASPRYPDAAFFLGSIELEDYHDVPAAITQFNVFLGDSPSPQLVEIAKPEIQRAFGAEGKPSPV